MNGAEYDIALIKTADWIGRHATFFLPPAGTSFETRHAQPITELAVALQVASICRRSDLASPLGLMKEGILEFQGRTEAVHRLLRAPEGFGIICYVVAALTTCGVELPVLKRCLQTRVDSGFLAQNERLPFRSMDIKLALEWCQVDNKLPAWSQLCESSILGNNLRVSLVDRSAAYALTHAIFFSTGFGTFTGRTWPSETNPGLPRLITMLLVAFCQEHDWDLVGELLVAWECLGEGETVVSSLAWSAFLRQQNENGSFDGPERHTPVFIAETDKWTVFRARYHTTLVAMLAMLIRQARLHRSNEMKP